MNKESRQQFNQELFELKSRFLERVKYPNPDDLEDNAIFVRWFWAYYPEYKENGNRQKVYQFFLAARKDQEMLNQFRHIVETM